MAAPIIFWEGLPYLARFGLAGLVGGANNATIRLFRNNFYPTAASSWTQFVECNFSGYSGIPIPGAVDKGVNFAGIDIWNFASVAFTMLAPPIQAAFGYWIDANDPIEGSRVAIWGERFNQPFSFVRAGDFLQVLLTPGVSQG